jgi:hypothetical protein
VGKTALLKAIDLVLGTTWPTLQPAVASAAEDAGLEELWLWEDCFWESGIASAAAALAWDRAAAGWSRCAAGAAVQRRPDRDGGRPRCTGCSLTGWTSVWAMASRSGWRRSGRGWNRP